VIDVIFPAVVGAAAVIPQPYCKRLPSFIVKVAVQLYAPANGI